MNKISCGGFLPELIGLTRPLRFGVTNSRLGKMTNIFDRKPFPTDVSTSTSTEPGSQPDAIQHHLWHWVSSWLEESIVELDTLIVMAPAELRLQFTGYSAMEHAIETMIHQACLSKAQHRLLAA